MKRLCYRLRSLAEHGWQLHEEVDSGSRIQAAPLEFALELLIPLIVYFLVFSFSLNLKH